MADKISEEVFREKIQEDRGYYFVEYEPAARLVGFAYINLTFPEGGTDHGSMRQAMEKELLYWLKRYPVPVLVSSFNSAEDLIYVNSTSEESHLMGYFELESCSIQKR